MSCMCGDYCCPSCGPAQGNWRCPICREWASEGCDHMADECTCGHPLSAHEHGIGDTGDWCGKIGCECHGYNAVVGLKPEFQAEVERLAAEEVTAEEELVKRLEHAYWEES